MPLDSLKVNCGFGHRIHPVTRKPDFHRGVDLSARSDPVFAILKGKVSAVGYNAILGNFVKIDHAGLESVYGHLSVILVSPGKELIAGDVIGITGSTGRVTGEHLHFSIMANGTYLDPVLFLLGATSVLQEGCL